MNHLLDNEDDEEAGGRRDREITLGTSTVLGIFFGLAILCAAFFGFGYSMGSKHVTPNVTANGDAIVPRSFNTFKPAPGSPITSSVSANTVLNPAPAPGPLPAPTPVKPPATGAAATPEAFEADQPVLKVPHTAPPAPVPVAVPVAAPLPAAPAQQLVVQVAALSHQEDAELIVTTLERRGYTVAIRPDPQDKLLHVQIGPFATRKDAEAMRQKLLADGFNAYIK